MNSVIVLGIGIIAMIIGYGGIFYLIALAKKKASVWQMLFIFVLSGVIFVLGASTALMASSVISGTVGIP